MAGPLNLHLAIGSSFDTDSDRFVADVARQPLDDVGVITIEAVREAKHPSEPLYERTPVGIE